MRIQISKTVLIALVGRQEIVAGSEFLAKKNPLQQLY